MSEKTVFEIIYQNTQNEVLKRIIHDHYIEDKWSEHPGELILLSNQHHPNTYDHYTALIFQIRQYSLLYDYKRSFGLIDNINNHLNRLGDDFSSLALKAFIYHTTAITLAYMGKIRETRFKEAYSNAVSYYKQLGLVCDLNRLKIEYLDVRYYYPDDFDLFELIKDTTALRKDAVTEIERSDLNFRLSVFNLMQYFLDQNNKYLIEAEKGFRDHFDKNEPINYKSYWAKCGLMIARYHQNKSIDKSFLEKETPFGAKSKAKGFPIILFLIIRAHFIAEKEKKAKDLLFDIERRVIRLLEQFPDDLDYQIIILERFGTLLEEWINYNIEFINDSKMEAACHIIHVNELLQNRLLLKENFLSSLTTDRLFNARKRIETIIKSGKGLIYTTIKVKNSQGVYKQYALVFNGMAESDISIIELDKTDINQLKLRFSNIFFTNSEKSSQDKLLNDYGQILNEILENIDLKDYVVVPNEFFTLLPIHMSRVNGMYTYETKHMNYLPNLSYFKPKNKHYDIDLGIYYTTKEENSVKEAEILSTMYNSTLYPDPDRNMLETFNRHNTIHMVCHHDGENIFLGDLKIKTDQIISLFSSKNKFVSLNICNSYNYKDLMAKYSTHSKTIALQLISKGVGGVLTHNWELSQNASLVFIKNYSLSKLPYELKNFKPIEYGGYMFWGVI